MATATAPVPVPPVAKKVPYKHKYFGVEYDDPYHWLKDMNKEKRSDIIDYLKEENAYAKTLHIEPNAKLIDTIYDEFISRIQEDDSDVPVYKEPFYYYKRTEKGKQYSIYARKKGSLDAPEEILLNQNDFDHEYQSLGFYRVSPDHSILAYSLDTTGDEVFTIYFKDLKTGRLFESDTIKGASEEAEWTNDNKAIYYSVLDEIHRPDKIFRHQLGTPSEKDELIYEEKDLKFMVGLEKSNSQKFIFVSVGSSLTRETHILDADDSKAKLRVFQPRQFRHKYSIDHQGDNFLILTDGGGKYLNFKLCSCPLDKTDASNWVDVLPYDPLRHLTGVQPFKGFVALYERSDALKRIRILEANAGGNVDSSVSSYYLDFDEELFTVGDAGTSTQNYDSNIVRFTYTSMLTSPQVLEYDVKQKEKKLLKELEVPNFDRSLYAMKRIYAPIPSETAANAPFDTPTPDRIPISIVYKKDLFKGDGTNPGYLYGYGSYGISIDPKFNSKVFSFVDRGYVYAIAHIRGGGENGRAWYETGKFKHKRNTFTDFIAAADELVKQNFTKHDIMAIEGRSAGGLLIGATVNFRPDVAAIAVAGVPFVDVINTMMDEKIPLTVNEYEEWGNPNEKDFFDYMLSYSPYENLKSGVQYPDMLVKAGLNDPRVQYWEPSKWVAKMRDLGVDKGKEDRVIVYDCKMGSGHFGHSGRYAYLKEVAADYAFVINRLEKRIKAQSRL
ncbi:hypothetical protein SpCBS45565_g01394 [Spizellomyces sp. 'palustris']|nr:hypothetical protein SpCBS45565_g01394 [Spizellomyces sp. 'palustris']